MKSLYEQFRPSTWNQLVGQDKLVKRLSLLRRRGLVGRVFWITGDSGTGKTTVARLVAGNIADDDAVIEIDAQDMGIDRVREFERLCQVRPLGKGCHVFIVNEAHGLSSKSSAVYRPCSNKTTSSATQLGFSQPRFKASSDCSTARWMPVRS
jgi:DNA polymerase III gamma/tau subunit